jgi:hypothetical protein
MFGSPLPPVVCRRAHVLLCFVCMFTYIDVLLCFVCMFAYIDVLLCFVCMFTYIDVQHFAVAHLFSFLCFVFCFVCLRPVSYVLTVADFSGLSILDFHFGFL